MPIMMDMTVYEEIYYSNNIGQLFSVDGVREILGPTEQYHKMKIIK